MRIAITGMGIVSAIGNDVPETLSSLLDERSGIHHVMFPCIGEQLVGGVPLSNESLSALLGVDSEMPRSVLMGIKSANEALRMARIDDAADVAFVNGTTVGGMDYTEQHYMDLLGESPERYKAMHIAGACSELIAHHIGAKGRVVTISTACSSALNSIIMACNMLRSGITRRVLAGGTECLTEFHQQGFCSLGIVDTEPCRPFDATRNGLNLGEGAAYLLLETEDDAVARGAEILGYVAGYGNACDAYHQTATSANGDGAFLAMRQALSLSGLTADSIDYINAHGTSTQDNDQSESRAIRRVFGDRLPMVSSTKGFTGHTTSASGSIETVISLIAMRNGFVPANINWHQPDDCLVTPVAHTSRHNINNVMCNSFGFGGNDSSLVVTVNPVDLPQITLVETSVQCQMRKDDDCSRWIKPMEARRMTPQMRQVVASACDALEQAGITSPDAIITVTSLGLIVNSLKLLDAMNNDGDFKPSLFMLSTHNSISSLLAMRFGCHGYNSTYCPAVNNPDDALTDAQMLISSGLADNVMVVQYEENESIWQLPAMATVRIIKRK